MKKINIPLKTVCLFYSMYVILNTQGQGVSHRVQGVSFCKLFSLYIILNTQGTGATHIHVHSHEVIKYLQLFFFTLVSMTLAYFPKVKFLLPCQFLQSTCFQTFKRSPPTAFPVAFAKKACCSTILKKIPSTSLE
jgi:hypothetical protein